jgi:hypothetical protein
VGSGEGEPNVTLKLFRSSDRMLFSALALVVAGGVSACNQAETSNSGETFVNTPPPGPAPQAITGHCVYTSPFTQSEECLEYHGLEWTLDVASADCTGRDGSAFVKAEACVYPKTLGRCVQKKGTPEESHIVFPGEDTSNCSSYITGCEVFAGGEFVADMCEGATTDPGGGGGTTVFEWPTLVCKDPLPGEPAGLNNGQVCTWNSISGCTEPGRKYADYGSCEQVLTQRPYWSAPPSDFQTPAGDPRLTDEAYQKELFWVKEQIEASACVCCHSEKTAPDAKPSNWYLEASPIWTDSFYPTGLALAAGWVDSTAFGSFAPEDNNGFSRDVTGLPSTDPARMKAFFEGELARRGYKQEDFVNETPFGGPLYDQSIYVPTECTAGQGVDAAGNINWTGGSARYVYVLAEGSKNPGAPPNLDLPEGTIFRFDVASNASAVKSGIAYGTIPEGAKQIFPAEGTAEKLVAGQKYLIYVLADIAVPLTRCVFTYPG